MKSESSNVRLRDIFSELAEHTKREFAVVLDHVAHPLEKGVAREKVLVSFLNKFLPERFGIGTGFVVDAESNTSKQVDIIVYDKIISPVFALPGGLRYFPTECVVAIGEVKTTLKDKKALSEALAKISSVKALNKFGNRERFDAGLHASHGSIGGAIENRALPENYQTFGFIFTSQSMSKNSLVEILKGYFQGTSKHLWPNIIIDFEKYVVSYSIRSGDSSTLVTCPDKANCFYVTKEEETKGLLLLFTSLLFRFLNESRVQAPDLMDYFGIYKSEVDHFQL